MPRIFWFSKFIIKKGEIVIKKYKGFKGSGYNTKKTKKRNPKLEQIADKMTTSILTQFGIEKKY